MLSEFDLIRRYFSRPVSAAHLGAGDDCALLAPQAGMALAVSTDTLNVDVHFLPDAAPRNLGWKALAVNLSDLAAMGAMPRWATLALTLPAVEEGWLAAFADGFYACAQTFGVSLVGGDTTRGPLACTVTILGEVLPGAALRRDGARDGDDIWVSGTPGLAALGLKHLLGDLVLPTMLLARCLACLECPQPRVALGLALSKDRLAHAAIDVSDGLLGDLAHMARASGLGASVWEEALPPLPEEIAQAGDADLMKQARAAQLSGGDDYELLFTAPRQHRQALSVLSSSLALPLWRVGVVTALPAGDPDLPVRLVDATGQAILFPASYMHF
jgi:thiamine-monophosphate kinase